MAKTWLKEGHSLKGRDFLPIFDRLRELPEELDVADMASPARKYPLASYSAEDLNNEVKRVIGHEMKVGKVYMPLANEGRNCCWFTPTHRDRQPVVHIGSAFRGRVGNIVSPANNYSRLAFAERTQ